MKVGKIGGRLRSVPKKPEKKEDEKVITVKLYSRPNMSRIYNPDINRSELEEWMASIIGKFSAKKFIEDFEKLEIIVRYGFNEPRFGELSLLSDWALQNAWDEIIIAYNEKDSIKMRFTYEDFENEIAKYIYKQEEIIKKDYDCADDEHPVFVWQIAERDEQWHDIRDKIKSDINCGVYTFLEPQLSEFYRLKMIHEQNKNESTFKALRMQFDSVDTVLQELFRKELVNLAEFHEIRNKLLK